MTDHTGWGNPGDRSWEQRQAGPGQQPPDGRQPPGTRPPAPKPGVVPLRPLGIGEILDGAVSYIRANPVATLGLAAIVITITQVVQVFAQLGVQRRIDETAPPTTPADIAGMAAAAGTTVLAGVAITFIAITVLTGLLIVVLSRAVLGLSASLGQAWEVARPRVAGLIGLSLLTGLIVAGSFLLAAIPGGVVIGLGGGDAAPVLLGVLLIVAAVVLAVYMTILLVMATPAYMLEGTTVLGALSRSRRLVQGSWWRIFGIALLAGLISAVITLLISLPFEFAAAFVGGDDMFTGTTSLAGLSLASVGAIVAGAVTAPFSAGVTGLLYIDQRMRREGFDLELARSATR